MPFSTRTALSLVIGLFVLFPAPSAAQSPAVSPAARVGTVTFVQRPPDVDGRLNDDVWLRAPVFDGFVQRELHEGAAVSERTEVRMLTDGEALYVGETWQNHRGVATEIEIDASGHASFHPTRSSFVTAYVQTAACAEALLAAMR